MQIESVGARGGSLGGARREDSLARLQEHGGVVAKELPSKRQRIDEYIRRLDAAPPADSMEGASRLAADTLNAVEDELTGLPHLLDPTKPPDPNDLRMYPSLEDNRHVVPGHPQVERLRSRGHNTFVRTNGAIRIERIDKTIELDKPGKDGNRVFE